MDHLFDGEDHEVDSWMPEFLVALLDEDYVAADFSIPLRQRESAVPRLQKTLELDANIWMQEDCNEFWEYPQFAQEFLQDLLTVAIVKPGRELLKTLENAVYLSPFRRLPSRAYRAKTGAEPRSWANGLAAWDLLSLGSETSLRESVSAWLTSPDRFNANYRVIAQRWKLLDVDGKSWNDLIAGEIPTGSEEIIATLERLPEESKLELQHVESGLALAPQDLGTAISQVIPVIVAALSGPSGRASRVVMIEEPEANIHPAFQVVLADLFITQAKASPGVLFLVETHSEHLMLRCLRADGRGRYGSTFPRQNKNKWRQYVRDRFRELYPDATPQSRSWQSLDAVLQRFSERMVERSARDAGKVSWLERVVEEHRLRPFHGILSMMPDPSVPEVITPDMLFSESPPSGWSVPPNPSPPRTSEAFAQALAPLLIRC